MSLLNTLTETESLSIANIASTVTLKKDELIISKGDRNEKDFFVESGIIRAFLIDEEGNEKSTAFFQEGEFMSTNTLRTKNGISIYNYQALNNAKILVFDSKKLKNFLSASKKLIELGKQIKERESARVNNRDECLIQVNATDKYLKFIQFYPFLEAKVSQRYIASFLGITPVSLSRLKKLMIEKTVIN